MVKKIVFLSLSILSLFVGMIFLTNTQVAVTGGFLGVTSTSISTLFGFVFIIISMLFYFLTGKAKKDENERL